MTKTEEIGDYIQEVAGDVDPFGGMRDPCEIFLEDNFPEPKFALTVGGIGTLPLGDIAAIKAKSKNGKTYLASMFGAAVFGAKIFGMESNSNEATVLYFDTEQNERNTARVLKRMHHLAGLSDKQSIKRLRAYSLRKMDTLSRWTYIEQQVEDKEPTLIIIDGVADLIQNFNEPVESSGIIDKLMKLSAEKDCSIICVLHTNKAKEDNNMKGHLGTFLVQKATDVFEVVKTGAVFTVKETECRNLPIEDFSFVLDDNGIPQSTNAPESASSQRINNEMTAMFEKVFQGHELLTYSELYKKYSNFAGVSERTAKNRIKDGLKKGYITAMESGGYKLHLTGAGG